MSLRRLLLAGLFAATVSFGGAFSLSTADAAVVAKVSLSRQSMDVYINGSHYATWAVSTGKRGFGTPGGSYTVKRMARMHYSKKYHNSPMPYSMFFRGGYAVHGTGYVGQLGRPASHGCVRLAPGNAAQLFSLVGQYGGRVVIGR
jgi:lipoprotein-anchoring transpeptidase ErfK/SrfK